MGLYSYTKLSTYKQYPYKYRLKYIDKVPEEMKTIEQFMGQRVHEALERLYKNLISGKTIPVEKFLEYYGKNWKEKWDDNIKFVKKDLSRDDYRELGEKCIKDYYGNYHPFNQSQTISVEKMVYVPLDEMGKYKIRGFIDRLAIAPDGTYEIHDYKTNRSLPAQKDKDEDKQLALYQIGVKHMWKDIHRVQLLWHYLVFNKQISSSRTDEDIEKLKVEKISLIGEIESATDFLPKESSLCNWCSYQAICPLWKHLFRVEQLPKEVISREEGVQLVDRLDMLQSERKRIEDEIAQTKEKLISYSEKEDVERIFGSNKVAKVKKEIKVSFPDTKDEKRTQLEKIVSESGKWDEVSWLDVRRLAKIVEDKGWDNGVIERIEAFGDKEVKKSVTLVKKKKGEEY